MPTKRGAEAARTPVHRARAYHFLTDRIAPRRRADCGPRSGTTSLSRLRPALRAADREPAGGEHRLGGAGSGDRFGEELKLVEP
jgi:hypothetical protein